MKNRKGFTKPKNENAFNRKEHGGSYGGSAKKNKDFRKYYNEDSKVPPINHTLGILEGEAFSGTRDYL